MICETVYIKVDDHPSKKVLIDKKDFDPETMELWSDEPEVQEPIKRGRKSSK